MPAECDKADEDRMPADTTCDFLLHLEASLSGATLLKLVLGKYRGKEPGLENLSVRPVSLKGRECLAFVYRYRTRDVTRNTSLPEGFELIRGLVGREFRSGHLFSTTQTLQLEFNKKGVGRISIGPATLTVSGDHGHDEVKERVIDASRPFLRELGVANASGQVFPSMSRKWKQINVFLGLVKQALMSSGLEAAAGLEVVDFGSGKGYLTFAVYDFLKARERGRVRVTGIEQRGDLVRFCREAATRLGMDGLSFQQGDVKHHTPAALDILIALHACDTATDLALHAGIRGGAGIIMCAPCCHKEIRPQMVNPPVLHPMLCHGVHQGQEAEMVTDTLRALWLEASGYDAQVFEFVSLEHTSKNKMILAVKRAKPLARDPVMSQIKGLMDFYGIRQHALQSLLSGE
jgi:protein-L-isoaspartate O-methyltransferase